MLKLCPLENRCITRKWLIVYAIRFWRDYILTVMQVYFGHQQAQKTIENFFATVARLGINLMDYDERSVVRKCL